MSDISILKSFDKWTKTNADEWCKQLFKIIESEGYDSALVIRKVVYVKDKTRFKIFEEFGFRLLKSSTNDKMRVYGQSFSIKLNTLKYVISEISQQLKAKDQ